MGGREGSVNRGRARGRALRHELGREIRDARLQHGLTQEAIGRVGGLSAAQVSRIERGLVRSLDVEALAILCAAVGLELSIRGFPAGEPLRDAGHLALASRFRGRLHPSVRWRAEVPLSIPGDLRAWDAFLDVASRDVGVEFETRPRDLQALRRRLALKARDGGVDAVVLVLADTRHNRTLVRLHADELAQDFPVPGARALELLGAGVFPGGSSLVLL